MLSSIVLPVINNNYVGHIKHHSLQTGWVQGFFHPLSRRCLICHIICRLSSPIQKLEYICYLKLCCHFCGSVVPVVWVYVHNIHQHSCSINVTIISLYFKFGHCIFAIKFPEIKPFFGLAASCESMDPINGLYRHQEIIPLAPVHTLTVVKY